MKLIMSDKPINLEIGENKDIKYIDLSSMKIANCVGCFGCWTKTPGKCVIRDDATKVYPYIAESSSVIYVSHIKYGGYDSVMKTMIERAIPIQQAFIRNSDVIIAFPLYADSLPVGLLNFLKNLENNLPAQRPVISILINCGFLEYEQNSVAVSMIRYFCRRNNFPIGSALMLGSGEAILETPFRYIAVRAIKRLSESVNKGNYKDITATMPLPKWLFKMAARSYWIRYGKKFGVSEKEMQRPEIES